MRTGIYNWSREYDNLQRPIKDTLPNGLEVIRSFNTLSQLESISNQGGVNSSLLSKTSYLYDDVGKRIAKTQNQVQANYGYDNLDRLTSVSNPTETFSYDAVGNRDSWMHNEINQLLSDNYKYNFEYNVNGEMTKRTNLKTGEITSYSWSTRGELEKVKILDSTNLLKKEITFKYDGLGRRIEKMVVNTTSPEKSYTRKYFYDGQNIVEEKDASNQTVATYLHTLGIDDPVLMERNGKAYVYTKDGLGSIKELTKPDGKVTQRYRYSAYGEITRELLENRPNKDLVENSYAYTYTGREFEEETGLYYYRARYYDAELGRFISEDPIGFDGGDVNFYRYVRNNPINYTDPTGEVAWVIPILVGAGILLNPLELENPNALKERTKRDFAILTVGLCAKGPEIKATDNFRLAPFGNKTGKTSGELPHYHRRGIGSGGATRPGQGIGRHRPWDKRSTDQSFWDRF